MNRDKTLTLLLGLHTDIYRHSQGAAKGWGCAPIQIAKGKGLRRRESEGRDEGKAKRT